MNIIEWISANKEWFFSGIGVIVLSFFIKPILKWIKSIFLRYPEITTPAVTQNVNITNNLNNSSVTTQNNASMTNAKLLKNQIHILFIDDENFSMVKIIKKAGWDNTSLKKDISNMDDTTLKSAHIVFVDINGVGKALQFQKQGIGLAAAIKDRYPQKKVVIYSGQSNGDRFDKDLHRVDGCIAKNAEPFEFETMIANFMAELNGETNN